MTKTLTTWGECPSCMRTRPLSGRGVMREHRRWVSSLGGEVRPHGYMTPCSGLGKRPAEAAPTGDTTPAGRHVQTVRHWGGVL
jgi:hypothetical protein